MNCTRTEKHYQRASEELSKALKNTRNKWGSVEVPPKLDDLYAADPLPQLREYILRALEKREEKANSKTFCSSCKKIAEHAIMATSPFAKNILKIAINAQPVSPGACVGSDSRFLS